MCEENMGGRLGRKLGNMGYDWGVDAFNSSYFGKKYKQAKEWFGQGDYVIKSNSIIDSGGNPENLKMVTNGNAYTDFIYREYLGDIVAPATPGNFNLQSYAIQPGMPQLHPWLSPIAQQFEQYEPMGIVFEYQSLLSDYSSTQVLGSIMMATDYDATDPPYQNKTEMMNAQYSSQAKPTEGLLHGIECDPSQRPARLLYVRGGQLGTNEDPKDYDVGNFQIATQGLGVAANTPIGSLFVHYHYRFYKQQISNGLPMKGQLSCLIGSTMNGAFPYLTSTFAYNSLGITLTTGNQWIFPPWITSGTFLILLLGSQGTAGPATLANDNLYTNCVSARQLNATSLTGFFSTSLTPNTFLNRLTVTGAGTGVTQGCAAWAITITGPNAQTGMVCSGWVSATLVTYIVNVSNFDTV